MKFAIVQPVSFEIDAYHYNNQAIGQGKALVNNGIDVDYFAPFCDARNPFEIYRYGKNILRGIPIKGWTPIRSVTFYPSLIQSIIDGQYSVVQVGDDSQFMTPLVLRAVKQKTSAETVMIQGMYRNFSGLKGALQKIFDLAFKNQAQVNADHVYGKTPMAMVHLASKGYQRIGEFPIGLDWPKESQNLKLQEAVHEFCDQYQYVALYIGSLERRRNPTFLIRLLDALRSEGDNVGLILVGSGTDLPSHKHILRIPRLANEYLHILFNRAQAFWLPSSYEIYGMVVMESLYWGCPIVATPEAGPLAILKDPSHGVCIPLSLDHWKTATRKIWDLNDSVSRHLRHGFVVENFDWNKLMFKFIADLKNSNHGN